MGAVGTHWCLLLSEERTSNIRPWQMNISVIDAVDGSSNDLESVLIRCVTFITAQNGALGLILQPRIERGNGSPHEAGE